MKSVQCFTLSFIIILFRSDMVFGETWAVLVAGSTAWADYRHQADVAHAYQLLVKQGVKSDKIITMMYDNIANNPKNPYPGKIYNTPDGNDVYAGLKVDYTGKNVSVATFLNVLKGNTIGNAGKGNEKVLNSTIEDNVFIYFVDHGGFNILGLPVGILTKKDLQNALDYMYTNRMYKKVLFYLDACNAGSMFEGLESEKRIFAVTASNSTEDSYSTYCYNKLKLPCLGDEFSVAWMQDSEVHNILTESVGRHVDNVARNTANSHVSQYGDQSTRSLAVVDFQGGIGNKKFRNVITDVKTGRAWKNISINSRQVPLYMIKKKLTNPIEIAVKIKQLSLKRAKLDDLLSQIVHNAINQRNLAQLILNRKPSRISKTATYCHDVVIKAFDVDCASFDSNPYAFSLSHVFANLCEVLQNPEPILQQFRVQCLNVTKTVSVTE
uniref:legumain n=1 Tax=Panagrellus redivivus TaxID=6233 RepID=A0A7E4UUI6_PANRE